MVLRVVDVEPGADRNIAEGIRDPLREPNLRNPRSAGPPSIAPADPDRPVLELQVPVEDKDKGVVDVNNPTPPGPSEPKRTIP